MKDAINADKATADRKYKENLEFLKSFLPSIKINGKDAYEMYRNREQFDSLEWTTEAIRGWFD